MKNPYYRWQADALDLVRDLITAHETDISVAAGVGSGKTYFASRVCEFALTAGHVEQIIVVTINRRCQRQWFRTLKQLNLPLKLAKGGNKSLKDGLPPDVIGYITTYASMGSFPDLHSAYCGAQRTFVVFDEVHHLNEDDQTQWGKQAKTAFDSASFRLCLSGTFFSSTGAPIPFARMQPRDGSNAIFEYDPHVRYSYGESVADGICRRIVFKPWDGPIEYKREDDTHFRTSTFADDIDPRDIGLRLWSACQPKGLRQQPNEMLEEMLFQAHRRLMDLRAAGHERAGGLIVCNEKLQARQIHAIIERISGHKAALVLDDEPGSEQTIDSFATGFMPWMVAIRMVTEGVDIPRLRVGVYASNVVQRLTFVQFIGRFVRWFKGDTNQKPDSAGESYVFFPGDARLRETASAIEQEMREAIDLREARNGGGGGGGGGGFYQSGDVRGEERDNLIAGALFRADEIEIAEGLRLQWPNLAEQQLLEMIKFVRAAGRPAASREHSPFDPPEEEDHDSIRRDCQRLARRLASIRGCDFNEAHLNANRAVGIGNVELATIEQLKAKRAWLREQIDAGWPPLGGQGNA